MPNIARRTPKTRLFSRNASPTAVSVKLVKSCSVTFQDLIGSTEIGVLNKATSHGSSALNRGAAHL